ncbi:MAG: EAL domain-containing protein [Magnetococcales bacterium]|nr:EAL domain-containing protein [Magnetococcales bacterium]
MTILIVDERSSVREELQTLLAECGEVTCCTSGSQCLALCQGQEAEAPAFDLIVLSAMLSDMAACDLCRSLTLRPQTAEIPVLMLVDEQVRRKGDSPFACKDFSCGAVDYITLPFSPSLVLARVKTHLRLRMALRRLQEHNARLQAQQAQLHLSCEIQSSLNKLLETMLEPLSLQEQLQLVLKTLFSVSWFSLLPVGAVMLRNEESGELCLAADHGFDELHRQMCQRIAPGHCLCGRVFADKELLFVGEVDERHDIRLPGMQPHGHYCVPIMAQGSCLGVLNLYLSPGHQSCAEEKQFLTAVANTLAGLLKRRHLETKLDLQTKFDVLTALPNRSLFQDRLYQAITLAIRNRGDVVLLLIDLDRFKLVNDTLGHEAGDRMLQEAGRRISSCLRTSDTVARLSGDEFAVILHQLTSPFYVELVARKILEQLAMPYRLLDDDVVLSGSMGISTFPHDAADADGLLKHADSAMMQAKKDGRSTFRFFTQEMQDQALLRMQREKELRMALEQEEFLIHYQPKISSRSGRIVGMEALVRWFRPISGMVSPGEFIPLAEETGLIVPIGAWILQAACRQNKAWIDAGFSPVRVAVNLSARQFQQSEELIRMVASVLAETALAPEWLELEITESMVMDNVDQAVSTMQQLRAMGVHISLDDFGTGYSSLGALKRFPLHALKIDRSFVRDLPSDAEDVAIVTATISMAHKMNLAVVAEGVETNEQLTFLRDNECDEIQGYFFSRPVPVEQFTQLLVNDSQVTGR